MDAPIQPSQASRDRADWSHGDGFNGSILVMPLTAWRRFAIRLRPVFALFSLFVVLPAHALEPSREDLIKAAIVYKIGKFVDWPANAFAVADASLWVCLLGEDGFAAALAGVAGRKVQGRRIDFKVIPVTGSPQPEDCHILFVPRSASSQAGAVIYTLTGKPVLTISDIPGFARSGGMIALVRSGTRIGFEIDSRAACSAGLAMRAQLLDLAEIVE
ncbi:YfiR family protein [Thiocystis violacea]|uniref:YfiR family protein n=1 Tax=Thiocystis violacea TaxID=13725 RepID=UPI00190361FF|nr:YfiR family protein [Thiocystis violacea]